MINKFKHSVKTGASKFFKSVALTGGMLLFVLKPGISKANEELKAELMKTLKEHSVTEWKIQESNTINDGKTATFNAVKDTVDPDTTTIKNFFLNGGFLTPAEIIDFNKMRAESTNSPSRPATYLTIGDIREIATNDYEKAIFTTTFLDPFQKTTLGKSAFQIVGTEKSLKGAYSSLCKIYTQNIRKIKIEKEIQKNKEIIKSLETIENIYQQYLNK